MNTSPPPRKIDFRRICDDHSLEHIVRKAGIKLSRAGRELVGLCPFHQEGSPSFHLYDGQDKEHYHCFGCGAHGDVIEFVQGFYKVDKVEAVNILTGSMPTPRSEILRSAPKVVNRDSEIEKARQVYKHTKPAAGTLVETYLRSRGIAVDKIGIPQTLRYAETKYWTPVAGQDKYECLGEYPAMIAPIQMPNGHITGVHITYINREGTGKLILPNPFEPSKNIKAKKIRGVKEGGCIRLGPESPHMMFAEGIETALSVKSCISGTRLDQPVWTFIDLDNLSKFIRPAPLTRMLILADNDMSFPTPTKPRDLRAFIRDTANRISKENKGLKVSVAWPPVGKDFNDMLKELVIS